MPEHRSNIDNLQQRIEESEAPASDDSLRILPVSHDEFQARWSLNQAALASGIRAASHDEAESHLILRAYSLPAEAGSSDFSSVWYDYGIDSTDNRGYFTLPAWAAKISAAIGLMNRSGRFKPLIKGDAIALPGPPTPAAEKAQGGKDKPAPAEKAASGLEKASAKQGSASPHLNEAEVSARLEAIHGLPESLKSSALGDIAMPRPGPHATEHTLDETEVLKTVRHKMAAEPEPEIPERAQVSRATAPPDHSENAPTPESGASEQLASQWEEIWSDTAPIELRAEYVLTGKLARGMKLLLGNEIIQPTTDGFIVWKRKLDSFSQVWPLLRAALESPSVAAGPSLEFFRDVDPSDRMLELHAALEIEGKVTDPAYQGLLPTGLNTGPDGKFKLHRMLPDGAVILPGLSLIAG